MDLITNAFGELMRFIYFNLAFENYGLAIIIFAILTKIAQLPLSIKSFRTMRINQQMQPELADIQRLYKDDKEKLNEEMMKIYKKYGASPTAGCLPLLILFPIVAALYNVIRRPLTHIMKITSVNEIIDKLGISDVITRGTEEINILNYLTNNPDKIAEVSNYIKPEQVMDLNFIGINLGVKPTIDFSTIFSNPKIYLPLLLVPILTGLTTYWATAVQTKIQQGNLGKKETNNNSDMPDAAAMTKSMTYFMPIMIVFFSFGVPAGLGLYWVVNNIIQMVQQVIFNKVLFKNKEEGV